MFICEKCRIVSQSSEKPVRIVTETREKTYSNKKRLGRKIAFKESKGFEIVKEKIVCQGCSA